MMNNLQLKTMMRRADSAWRVVALATATIVMSMAMEMLLAMVKIRSYSQLS